MDRPIIEIDVHGMTVECAIRKIVGLLAHAGSGTYRLRVVHGFNRGNRIQQELYREFRHEYYEKIKRVEGGSNPGITEIVLRDF